MTNVIKCNECNIVIDELLSYLQNKVSVADEVTLIRICSSSFTAEEIKKSKGLLFDSIPGDQRKVLRKNKGKEERDLADIISLLKSTEPEDIPVFVAKQLDKLPPILFDHLDCTKLLKDILLLKSEIQDIKNTYATMDSVEQIKIEFQRMRNVSPPASVFKVNAKRGGWVDSGPMGLSQDGCISVPSGSYGNSCNETETTTNNKTPSNSEMKVDEKSNARERSRLIVREQVGADSVDDASSTRSARVVETTEPARSSEAGATITSHTLGPPPPERPLQSSERSNAANGISAGSAENGRTMSAHENEGEWRRVERRKPTKYRYLGKSGVARDLESAGSFRAAERKIPMFITNVHMSTTEHDISEYIFNKTNETVSLEKINMKFERGHKAYKFYISESNMHKYMDENLWPEGVIFRRFVHFTRRKDLNGVGGSNLSCNG